MICSCPKCAASIEVDLSNIPEDGTFLPCPECKARFWINRESYAKRALKKEGKLFCEKCGHELGHSIVCAACGVLYPDYYLVQVARPPRRQAQKANFSLSFSVRPARQDYSYIASPKSDVKAPGNRKFIKVAVSLLVLAALLTFGVKAYRTMEAEKLYAMNFVRALYIVKSGADVSLKACAQTAADWKTKLDAGQSFIPLISTQEQSRLGKIKNELDIMMQRLDKPPPKFSQSKEALVKLNGVYTSLHSLAVNPPGSLRGFTDSSSKLEGEFKTAAQELKAGLPPGLSKELKKSKNNKVLQDF